MRFCAKLLSVTVLLLAGCGSRDEVDHGFTIRDVKVTQAYQSLVVHLRQELVLSPQAREALEHGVTLVITLEMELRSGTDLINVQRDAWRYRFRYLPLSERYQLADEASGELRVFSRLRHLLAAVADLSVRLTTGPLPPGEYELRTRLALDERRLPAPMQLPAWFSRQWQHDSDWSVWTFKISA